jgi:hypothetical protein
LDQAQARVVLAGPSHPLRGGLEAFVEQSFAVAYGARIAGHYPLIAGLVCPDGVVLAAAGLRFAEQAPLFLETYLDIPIETAIGEALGGEPTREMVVEIGAFASRAAVWTLQLFEFLPPWLWADAGRRYAAATLRPDLARMLSRSGFGLTRLRSADAARLGQAASAWGSYYAGAPCVYVGRIGQGAALPALQDRLRMRPAERQARDAGARA